MFLDENVHVWWNSSSWHFTRHKCCWVIFFCNGQVQHSHLGHLGTHLPYWKLPPAVLMILEILADFGLH